MLLSATSNRVALIDIKPLERTSVAPPTAQSPHLAFLTFRLVDDDRTRGGRNGAAFGTTATYFCHPSRSDAESFADGDISHFGLYVRSPKNRCAGATREASDALGRMR